MLNNQNLPLRLIVYISYDDPRLARYVGPVLDSLGRTGASPEVRVLGQIDLGRTRHVERFELSPRDWTGKAYRMPLANFPDVDSGTPAAWLDFFSWCDTRGPADRSILYYSGHGQGHILLSQDKSSGSSLNAEKFRDVLQAHQAAGNGRFEIVCLDSCLMAQAEFVYEIADIVPYVVASQASLPYASFDLGAVAATLAAEPGEATERLALDIAKAADQNARGHLESWVNFVVLRGSGIKALWKLLDTWAEALLNDPSPSLTQSLRRARTETLSFAHRNRSMFADLGHFLKSCARHGIESDSPLAALPDAVAANLPYGEVMKDSTGVSVFFPTETDQWYLERPFYSHLQANREFGHWIRLVDRILGV